MKISLAIMTDEIFYHLTFLGKMLNTQGIDVKFNNYIYQ